MSRLHSLLSKTENLTFDMSYLMETEQVAQISVIYFRVLSRRTAKCFAVTGVLYMDVGRV